MRYWLLCDTIIIWLFKSVVNASYLLYLYIIIFMVCFGRKWCLNWWTHFSREFGKRKITYIFKVKCVILKNSQNELSLWFYFENSACLWCDAIFIRNDLERERFVLVLTICISRWEMYNFYNSTKLLYWIMWLY